MRWRKGHKSVHVEDRRGGARRKAAVGGIGGIIVLLVGAYFGVDVSALLGGGGAAQRGGVRASSGAGQSIPADKDRERPLVEFVSFVHDDIQTDWGKRLGARFRPATLVLYRQGTPSGCGYGDAAIGPFYCPADDKVYVDLSFFEQLAVRFEAPGDFAQAYVLAHEIGHHLQNIEGTSARVQAAKKRMSKEEGNRESVKLELQADCLAGVWARGAKSRDLLEAGDIEEGLAAATAIGDDAIAKMSGRRVQPETWTHGSSEQRVSWFRRGFESGDPARCDTFSAR